MYSVHQRSICICGDYKEVHEGPYNLGACICCSILDNKLCPGFEEAFIADYDLKPLEPCVDPDCPNTYGGLIRKDKYPQAKRPRRTSGKRFGIIGYLCNTCYYKHYMRYKRRWGLSTDRNHLPRGLQSAVHDKLGKFVSASASSKAS